MDVIQNILVHSVVIGGFVVLGTLAKVTSAASLRRSLHKSSFKSSLPKLSLLFLLCVVICGCSKNPDRLAVKGKITLDGAPIPNGSILMKPTEKGPQVGTKIVNGEYAFNNEDGPIPGSYRVEIYQDDANPFPLDDPQAFARQAEEDPSKLNPENKVPPQFNRLSQLTAKPAKENQEIDFDLETSKRP